MRLIVVVLILIVTTASTRALVVLLDDRAADALDLLLLLLDLLRVRIRVRGKPILAVLDRIVHGLILVLIHLLTEALVLAGAFHSRLHGVEVVVERVARVDLLLQRLVLLRELLSLLDHALDLLLRQAALVVRDGDLLRVASALVLRTDHQDAVAVNLERHVELAELVVVLRHRALTLVHLNGHRRLVVLVRREHLRLLRRDHRVARDELGHHSADRLDTERERGDVQEQEVRAALAGKDSRLHSRAVRNGLVRVDATVRLLAVEEVLHQRLDLRDARGPAHEHDLVHLRLLQAGVVHDVLHRAEGLLEEVRVQLLEARARQGLREVNAVEERHGRLRPEEDAGGRGRARGRAHAHPEGPGADEGLLQRQGAEPWHQPGRGRCVRRGCAGGYPFRRGRLGPPAPGRHPAHARYRDGRRRDDQAHLAQHGDPDEEVAGVLDEPGQPADGDHSGVRG